jgi:phosphate transport system permease protein
MVMAFATIAYFMNTRQALVFANRAKSSNNRIHSLPSYHGWFAFIITGIPAIVFLAIASVLKGAFINAIVASQLPQEVKSLPSDQIELFLLDASKIAFGGEPSTITSQLENFAQKMLGLNAIYIIAIALIASALAIGGYLIAKKNLKPDFRARNIVETIIRGMMILAASLAILTTFGIVLSLIFETIKFFNFYNPFSFLFGTQWSPQVAIRADQVGQSGSFGAVPLFLGTFMIMLIAMAVAVPVGLGSAIYLSEYASEKARAFIKPALELLAGIPTVVYGFFALLTVAPFIRNIGTMIGLETSSQSALAAGLVMGIMIIPFISSLSDDVINAVPQALRDGSYAMGATKSETVAKVVVPAALPGIIGSVLLAVSRALGETMIVAMAAGQNANMSLNPLDMMTTVTVQIVMLLTGDQEYDSPKTHVAFALGFVLFVVTLILNIIALRVVQKYREKYD